MRLNTKTAIFTLAILYVFAPPSFAQSQVPTASPANHQKDIPPERGLALTPPMGWNSWNTFGLRINEQLIRSMADAMVSTGMRDAGYQYVIVDAGWKNVTRDSHDRLTADPIRFPSGIKALAAYVHGKGLRFGIYTDAGSEDCDSGGPGSKGHEVQDAVTFAEWGVDFVKEDWCKSEGLNARKVYTAMSKALYATRRPIVFSICEWGDSKPWLWAGVVANMWRTTGDNQDCWDCGRETMNQPGGYPRGWTLILDAQVPLQQFAAPGRWNDPDMLEVGGPGLTTEESRAHFSLWAILAAPLIAGADLRAMPPHIADIFLNKEVIAVDQDAIGVQGSRVKKDGDFEVWSRPLKGGGNAVVLFNRSDADANLMVSWKDLGTGDNSTYEVRNLWSHLDLGKFKSSFSARVPKHGVVMIRTSVVSPIAGRKGFVSPTRK